MLARAPQLVLGIGNLLRGDDGVGAEVVQRMAGMGLPAEVEIHDGGTSAIELSSILERRRRVVVIDSVDAGSAAGTIFRYRPDEIRSATRTGLSIHDFHLLDALDETRLLGYPPREVVILAVQVGSVEPGIGLTQPVSRAIDRLIQLILEELRLSEHQLTNATACARSGSLDAAGEHANTTEAMP